MSKVLIVDDEEDIVMVLRKRLETKGFEVDFAHESQKGLEKAKQWQPDLIILDVMMPIMNGYQLCRAIKADPKTQSIPVLLCTAKGEESDKFWGKECGASDHIVKPFDNEDLLRKIKDLIAQPS